MSNKMEWSFWLPTIGGAILTIIGVALATWSAINSHNESLIDKAKADSAALENKALLNKNYEKSLNIIKELNESSKKTKTLLDNTTEVLSAQKQSSELISKQLQESIKINESIQKSGEKISNTVNEATKKLNDNVTGGDGYCQIKLVNSGTRKFRLAAINQSPSILPNVIIKVENTSEMIKCTVKEIDGIQRMETACVNNNTAHIPERTYNIGTNYFLGGDNFIDTSGNSNTLGVQMITMNNYFYVQIIYAVTSDTSINYVYRILKQNISGYTVVESNEKDENKMSDAEWNARFPIPLHMPLY